METVAERFQRIEARISVLEEEEKVYIHNIQLSLEDSTVLLEDINENLKKAVSSACFVLDSSIIASQDILTEIVNSLIDFFEKYSESLRNAKKSIESIDVDSDANYFILGMFNYLQDNSFDQSLLIDMPSSVYFEPISNDLIEEERRQIKMSMTKRKEEEEEEEENYNNYYNNNNNSDMNNNSLVNRQNSKSKDSDEMNEHISFRPKESTNDVCIFYKNDLY